MPAALTISAALLAWTRNQEASLGRTSSGRIAPWLRRR